MLKLIIAFTIISVNLTLLKPSFSQANVEYYNLSRDSSTKGAISIAFPEGWSTYWKFPGPNGFMPKIRVLNENRPRHGDIFLSFGPHPKEIDGLTLTESKNLEEAAKNLFTFLHILVRMSEAKGGVPIKVAPIPSIGVGAAINDRLLRAMAK